jgi:putative methylase
LAFLSNDIKNKGVLDLGCGSGKLAIGSALLEAREVIAVDIDEEVLNIAIENLKIVEKLTDQKFNNRIKFIKKDVSELDEKVDTVIQNPPFGIQKLHADRLFLKKALECGDKIYSLHRSYERTREFLTNFIKDNKGKVEKIISFKFRIPYMFKFHERPSVNYDVDLFIISKV